MASFITRVLTAHATDADITRAVTAGACGYLLKDTQGKDLLAAVHAAARGETVLAGPAAAKLGQVAKDAQQGGQPSY